MIIVSRNILKLVRAMVTMWNRLLVKGKHAKSGLCQLLHLFSNASLTYFCYYAQGRGDSIANFN